MRKICISIYCMVLAFLRRKLCYAKDTIDYVTEEGTKMIDKAENFLKRSVFGFCSLALFIVVIFMVVRKATGKANVDVMWIVAVGICAIALGAMAL